MRTDSNMPVVYIGGLASETNSFSPFPMSYDQFVPALAHGKIVPGTLLTDIFGAWRDRAEADSLPLIIGWAPTAWRAAQRLARPMRGCVRSFCPRLMQQDRSISSCFCCTAR